MKNSTKLNLSATILIALGGTFALVFNSVLMWLGWGLVALSLGLAVYTEHIYKKEIIDEAKDIIKKELKEDEIKNIPK